MRALIINLDRATDRLALQQRQMQVLGIAWARVAAVTPDTLEPPVDDPLWHRWQRPLRATEKALLASHARAWSQVVKLDEPCLILEDDALLAVETPVVLDRIAATDGIDHVSLETRSRKKIVARRPHPTLPIRRLWQDRTGSAAYVLFPSGARKLLGRAAYAAAPSDAAISGTYSLRSFQADPALAIQLDQCAAYGVPQPLATASSIDAVPKPPATDGYSPLKQRLFRARRIGAQLRMGWRQLSRLPVAQRIHVPPAERWPDLTLPE
ncbi:hypothetical protein BV394_09780 [Brevirhabdus pacifica]|uniref:Glycosyl transferase family 25 domain-containing protein n=1 Tax=Brevirhabdus pacifica TaxID=1267768 RepID=A0A1U7DJ07_9RHOB|nr:glycosyltransferase family 25 protein [Brevirhabdus pacifica]APX89972.1 hypothetical protein BV394_09780 [Brevirhabdus pacifica]PJJ82794.1 glycosyl transferase family 25 [Brevirhabdus pacifica]